MDVLTASIGRKELDTLKALLHCDEVPKGRYGDLVDDT